VTAFTTSGVLSIEAVYNGDTASASSSGYTVVSVAPTANFFQIALGYLIPFAHFFHLVGF